MLGFFILIMIVVLCLFIFGKADTKRELLNEIGFDLSESNYVSKKETEFAKSCKKAIRIAAEGCNVKLENEFLNYVYSFLNRQVCKNLNIDVKKHYVDFALRVVERRMEAISKGERNVIFNDFDFSNKSEINRYIERLWDKYQYPWPKNWLQRDVDFS